MHKLNVVIVDDNPQDLLVTLNLMLAENETFEVITTFINPVQALDFVRNNKVDLILLDINMGEMSGFDFIEQIKDLSTYVIFVTQHEEYAVRAFEVAALDYLLKPVTADRLKLALKKITEGYVQNLNLQAGVLNQSIANSISGTHQVSRIIINNKQSVEILPIEDILYCEAQGSYTVFFKKDGKQLAATKPLKYFENILPRKDFFRLHRSFIVSLDEVQIIDKVNYVVKLNNGINLPIGIDRLSKFIETVNSVDG